MHKWLGDKGEGYVLIQALIFILLIFGPRSVASIPIWNDDLKMLTRPVGLTLFVAAFALAIVATFQLRKHLSALPHPKKHAELIQTGVYAWVRHPIYSGLIFVVFSWALVIGSSFMLAYSVILFVFFEFKTRFEEIQLEQAFPDYVTYKARVKKLIPFLY